MKEISRIVITGGPCAGKTTALVNIREFYEQLGYKVIIVPEAATIVINAGFSPGENFPVYQFQKLIATIGLNNEKILGDFARACKDDRVLMVHDRGMMDSRAYMTKDEFGQLMREFGATEITWRDMCYSAVFHLTTAALGAEEFYTLSNNTARKESPELARELDKKTLDAWIGHPHLRVIDNSTDFNGKLARLRKEISSFLGIPIPIEIERKFLISPLDLDVIPVTTTSVEIEQTYIAGEEGAETRVRRRGIDGSYAYYKTTKRGVGSGTRTEVEIQIEEHEYNSYLRSQIPGTRTIRKTRTCFMWDNQYFEIDRFDDGSGLWILEIELTDRQQEISIPPFIHIIEEVTDDPRYKNATLAGCT